VPTKGRLEITEKSAWKFVAALKTVFERDLFHSGPGRPIALPDETTPASGMAFWAGFMPATLSTTGSWA
jgi:hypothetical protein